MCLTKRKLYDYSLRQNPANKWTKMNNEGKDLL